jgi:hypothetical protein
VPCLGPRMAYRDKYTCIMGYFNKGATLCKVKVHRCSPQVVESDMVIS